MADPTTPSARGGAAGSGQVLPRSATAVRFHQLLAQPGLGVISPTLGLRLELGDGASPSVVRAGIMGILLVVAPAFGRRSLALNALAISAHPLISALPAT